MPSIKRSGVKAQEVKTGFESYDGPEPHKRGMYRSKITQAKFKQFKTGSQGYVLLLELEAEKGDPKDHSQFDGYPIWTNLIIGDKEAMITRENNFLAAIGAKDDPTIVFEDGDLEDGVKIKTIGGKNPVGQIVNADIKMGSYNGEPRPEVDGVYKLRSAGSATTKKATVVEPDEEEEDEDLLEGSDEAEELTAEEREEELNGLTLPALRKIAKEDYDLPTAGRKKPDLIADILDYEYGEGVEEDAEDDEEEPDEDEVDEVDEDEADDEEEDEDEPDDEEEEEDDERAEREQELAELNRLELKRVLKDLLPDFTVLKRHSDDDIRERILDEEFGADDETPF